MLQRARDYYRSLDAENRAAADALLQAVGGDMFIDFEDLPRLARSGLSVKVAQ
jgi:hypothetical protein